MKILVIGFTKMKYMPYMNFYLNNIDCDRNEVHFIYWNRDGLSDIFPQKKLTFHEFSLHQRDDVPKQKKITNFLKFRKFAVDIIKKGNFDYIVVSPSIPAILFTGILTGKYKEKFTFDYRDVTYEGFLPFKMAVSNLIRASRETFISSDAFREVLPDSDKIHITHNFLESSLSHRHDFVKKTETPVSMSYWGFIRHADTNLKIIKALANDERFVLNYYGREDSTGQCLRQYCADNGVKNVFFHGEYSPEERFEFGKTTQIIHNMYDNNVTRYAMGNKYYDGIIMRIPQICTVDSFMGETAEKAGVGLMLNPESESFADDVFNYYQSLDAEKFSHDCDAELERVLGEYRHSTEVFKRF